MSNLKSLERPCIALLVLLVLSSAAVAQHSLKASSNEANSDFGPVMRAYLGYLANEQEVVDDRNSRREISPAYYRRNSSRIRALRTMAVKLARQSGNDYVPELEAVTVDEFGTIFEKPPKPAAMYSSEIVANKFRFLGTVHSGDLFYLFARLDPYEQAELMQRQSKSSAAISEDPSRVDARGQRVGQASSRPRRVVPQ
jgi:hypothetical protein